MKLRRTLIRLHFLGVMLVLIALFPLNFILCFHRTRKLKYLIKDWKDVVFMCALCIWFGSYWNL